MRNFLGIVCAALAASIALYLGISALVAHPIISHTSNGSIAGIMLMLAATGIYMTPTILAMARKKRNALAIAALNVLLGWTVLGWVAAFVWSLSYETRAPQAA